MKQHCLCQIYLLLKMKCHGARGLLLKACHFFEHLLMLILYFRFQTSNLLVDLSYSSNDESTNTSTSSEKFHKSPARRTGSPECRTGSDISCHQKSYTVDVSHSSPKTQQTEGRIYLSIFWLVILPTDRY